MQVKINIKLLLIDEGRNTTTSSTSHGNMVYNRRAATTSLQRKIIPVEIGRSVVDGFFRVTSG